MSFASVRRRLISLSRLLRLARKAASRLAAARCAADGGIVQLVRQIAGQLPQCRELFRLLLDAGDFAHAVEQRGNHALRHRGMAASISGKSER